MTRGFVDPFDDLETLADLLDWTGWGVRSGRGSCETFDVARSRGLRVTRRAWYAAWHITEALITTTNQKGTS